MPDVTTRQATISPEVPQTEGTHHARRRDQAKRAALFGSGGARPALCVKWRPRRNPRAQPVASRAVLPASPACQGMAQHATRPFCPLGLVATSSRISTRASTRPRAPTALPPRSSGSRGWRRMRSMSQRARPARCAARCLGPYGPSIGPACLRNRSRARLAAARDRLARH